MSVVKNTLPPGYTGWWAGSPEVRRALAGEVAAPLYKALQVRLRKRTADSACTARTVAL